MMLHPYYSRGKLLISGEYLVLLGAVALAVPVRFGQKMQISPTHTDSILLWNSFVQDKPWFNAEFSAPDLSIKRFSDHKSAVYVQQLMTAARQLNPEFLCGCSGHAVECRIDFDIQWGLGSSSSLISNVAYWADVDPLELHTLVSKGSGYDVVCARSSKPVLFETQQGIKQFSTVDFNPPFSKNIYFIYLGKKKDSQADVDVFMKYNTDYQHEIRMVSNISRQMAVCTGYDEFGKLMLKHEEIMSGVLGKPILKDSLFSDFQGEIKSLGAWGGDFAMVLWPNGKDKLISYLSAKNINVCFSFNEMIYESQK